MRLNTDLITYDEGVNTFALAAALEKQGGPAYCLTDMECQFFVPETQRRCVVGLMVIPENDKDRELLRSVTGNQELGEALVEAGHADIVSVLNKHKDRLVALQGIHDTLANDSNVTDETFMGLFETLANQRTIAQNAKEFYPL
jgi:hypothetical protein